MYLTFTSEEFLFFLGKPTLPTNNARNNVHQGHPAPSFTLRKLPSQKPPTFDPAGRPLLFPTTHAQWMLSISFLSCSEHGDHGEKRRAVPPFRALSKKMGQKPGWIVIYVPINCAATFCFLVKYK